MENNDVPNRPADIEKAKDDRWSSDPSTVERRDAERRDSGGEVDPGSSKPGDEKEEK